MNSWSLEPETGVMVTPLIVPPGPVSVTSDAVNVAGLISSLKFRITELMPELLLTEPSGVAETT